MSSSTTPQPPSTPAGESPKVAPAESGAPRFTLEEKVQIIWAKHRGAIIGVCVGLILAVVIVEWVKDYRVSQREKLGVAFGAADTPEKLRAFANEHDDSRMGGLAWLKLADQAFEAGRFSEASGNYEKAAARLSGDAFGARATYGQAMSDLAAGNKAKGEGLLRTIAADTKAPKSLRAEVSYQLAVLAKDAGRIDEARKLIGEVEVLDPAPYWVREAASFRMTLGAAAGAKP